MKRHLLASGIMIVLLRMGGAVLSLCVTVFLSRSMGAEGFGVYSYALTAVALASIPMGNGWATLLLRTASESHKHYDWMSTKGIVENTKFGALLVSFLFVVVGGGLLWVRPNLLSQNFSVVSVFLLAIVLFFDQMSANRVALLRAIEKPQFALIPDQLARPALIILGVLTSAYFMGATYSAQLAFLVLAVAAFLNFCIGHMMARRLSPKSLLRTTSQQFSTLWIKQALILSGGPGLIILNGYTDILLLGFFVDAEDIAYYKVAAQIGTFSGLGYVALNFIAAQKFAAYRCMENKAELQSFVTFSSRIAFSSVVPVFIVLYFFGESIVGYVFGEGFHAAVPAIIVLCVLQLVSSGFGMCNTLLAMNGMEKYILVLTAMSLMLNVLLCVLLIPRFGIIGAAVANLLATGAWNFSLWFTACNRLSVDASIVGFDLRGRA